jgi:hypothetical protein
MSVLTTGSAHATPSAQPPIDVSRNCSPHMSAKSKKLRKPQNCFLVGILTFCTCQISWPNDNLFCYNSNSGERRDKEKNVSLPKLFRWSHALCLDQQTRWLLRHTNFWTSQEFLKPLIGQRCKWKLYQWPSTDNEFKRKSPSPNQDRCISLNIWQWTSLAAYKVCLKTSKIYFLVEYKVWQQEYKVLQKYGCLNQIRFLVVEIVWNKRNTSRNLLAQVSAVPPIGTRTQPLKIEGLIQEDMLSSPCKYMKGAILSYW